MRVRLDRRAIADLEEIRAFLMQRSPAGADRVRQHIAMTLDRLGDFPFLGRETDEPGVRVLALTRYPYLIFYAVLEDAVAVLHIRHGAREPLDPGEL
jgi:plasmid stabilization system protein ParE